MRLPVAMCVARRSVRLSRGGASLQVVVALALQRLSDRLVAVAQALADLKMAGEIAPEDKNVIKASNRVKKLKKKQEEREKKMCACPAFCAVCCSRLFQEVTWQHKPLCGQV